MFAVIYRWRVIAGLEAQFEAGWAAATAAIVRDCGGWGSRLHKADGGVYVAYAQWPDEATWKAAMEVRALVPDDEARRKYRDAIAPGGFETLFAMPVTADMLDLRRA